ncbi:MAG: response regulator [Cyanothece sp. SIO2G6]|nr:response regulator [Cyanothece sp. SIO2G6]
MGDVTRLRQVLVNLLGNAVKFTHEGEILVDISARIISTQPTELTTSQTHLTQSHIFDNDLTNAEQPGSFLDNLFEFRFAVKDTGIGIPQDRLGQLFDSFSQVDSSVTRRYGGTGLGLAICKKLCGLMGGDIWVESVMGEGSTFYFTIQARATQNSNTHEQFNLSVLQGKRLLIIDDNPTNCEILTTQTTAWGMRPEAYHSPQAALDVLERQPINQGFDVVILDLHMPEMDGLSLAQAIRRRSQGQTIPLVMATASAGPEKEQEAMDAGFAAFLNKPIKHGHLLKTLMRFVGQETHKPFHQQQSDQLSTSTEADIVDNHRPLKILIAEDNLVNQQLAIHLLRNLGYRADVASNGLEVLESVSRQHYDIVLMDVQMPEMDGLTATRQLCQQYADGDRPYIIAMTANAMTGDKERCLGAGMSDYVSKPIRKPELVNALNKYLSQTNSTNPDTVKVAGTEDEAILKLDQINELKKFMGDNSSAYLLEIIDAYIGESASLLQKIDTCVQQTDAKGASNGAHSLKSSSAAIGAEAMSKICAQIEKLGLVDNVDSIRSLLPQLHTKREQTVNALSRFCQNLN